MLLVVEALPVYLATTLQRPNSPYPPDLGENFRHATDRSFVPPVSCLGFFLLLLQTDLLRVSQRT